MKKKIWTVAGILATPVALALGAVWTSTDTDLSSRLGNTAGVLGFATLIGGMVTLFILAATE